MNEKTEFLRKVLELFLENGAKTLTMDDIAKEFSISKKTLYQQYKNKEELLIAVLDFKLNTIIENIHILDIQTDNAIEKMILREKNFENFSRTNTSLFIRQLLKYYPGIFNQHIIDMNEKISKLLVLNIEKGRQQKLYRTDFNEKLYIKFFLQLMLSYENSPLFEDEEAEREEFCFEAVMFYLYSIATEEGRRILNNVNYKEGANA